MDHMDLTCCHEGIGVLPIHPAVYRDPPLVDEVVEVASHELGQDSDHRSLAVDDPRTDLQAVPMPTGRAQQAQL